MKITENQLKSLIKKMVIENEQSDKLIPMYLIELWFAVHSKETDKYEKIGNKLDSLSVPFKIQNEVSTNAQEMRRKKSVDVFEVQDIVKKILKKYQ